MSTTQLQRDVIGDIKVIDVDTHLTEPHDLWTSRAPRGWEDRVPQVREVDGRPMWTIDGNVIGERRRRGGDPARRDEDRRHRVHRGSHIEDVHPAAYDVDAAARDDGRRWASTRRSCTRTSSGFGGQKFATIVDPELRMLCATIFNDAMAEIQEQSGGSACSRWRSLPWWDIDGAVARGRARRTRSGCAA